MRHTETGVTGIPSNVSALSTSPGAKPSIWNVTSIGRRNSAARVVFDTTCTCVSDELRVSTPPPTVMTSVAALVHDVLVTVKDKEATMSRAVVSNVQVLTAGTRYDQELSKDGKPIPSTVVTLMVTPTDAERIALAQNTGSIMLVLRNPLDQKPTETTGVRLASLMGNPDAPPVVKVEKGQRRMVVPKPVPAVAPVPSIYSIEAIKAAKRSEEIIK